MTRNQDLQVKTEVLESRLTSIEKVMHNGFEDIKKKLDNLTDLKNEVDTLKTYVSNNKIEIEKLKNQSIIDLSAKMTTIETKIAVWEGQGKLIKALWATSGISIGALVMFFFEKFGK